MNMDFADPDSSGTWRLMPVPDSEFVLDADTVILAAEHKINQDVLTMVPGLRLNSNGTVWLNKKNHMTSCPGVFAAGDVVLGADTLAEGMASGKEVAKFIAQYLRNN
jgi:glutamate synthase (NADPH/NADH) small chain